MDAKKTQQNWDPQSYEKHARFVSDLGAPVVQLLKVQAGERVLDLGCGDGVLSKKLEDMGCELVGVDASPAFVAAARKLGLEVMEQSAYEIDFREEFDAVFSNAALHWMKDADRVIKNVFRALRAGGRFVAECGGHKCCLRIQTALIAELEKRGHDGWAANPWYFPTVQDYGSRLAKAGFETRYIEIIPRPTPLPGDILGWLHTFAGSFSAVLPPGERHAYLEDVRSRVEPALCDSQGRWTADYTRLRFAAHKPATA